MESPTTQALPPDSERTHVQLAAQLDATKRLERWQTRLLPFMTRLMIALALFFFLVSLTQMAYLHWRIDQSPAIAFDQVRRMLSEKDSAPAERRMAVAGELARLELETNAIERRYHQASVVLMARVWTSYLGFVTGMVLVFVGAAFVLGQVQGTATDFEAKLLGSNWRLKTAAPGIILTVLGVLLMSTTLFVKYQIAVTDTPTYVIRGDSAALAPTSSGTTKPEILWPAAGPDPDKEPTRITPAGSVAPEISVRTPSEPSSGIKPGAR
jgi:hypothetical protein